MIEITPLGDSALTIRFAGADKVRAEQLLAQVLAARAALDRAKIPGVLETTSSYSTVAVFLDMPQLLLAHHSHADALEQTLARIRTALTSAKRPRRVLSRKNRVEVPVCFDPSFALDLIDLAKNRGLKPETAIRKFCAADYQVACIGFMPGFPYLVGLPSELSSPRRDVPRVTVPAGSVGIGGNHAGIYPVESPGGWNLIGRTPLRLFQVDRTPASLLAAGDRVRFKAITVAEFEKIQGGSAK